MKQAEYKMYNDISSLSDGLKRDVKYHRGAIVSCAFHITFFSIIIIISFFNHKKMERKHLEEMDEITIELMDEDKPKLEEEKEETKPEDLTKNDFKIDKKNNTPKPKKHEKIIEKKEKPIIKKIESKFMPALVDLKPQPPQPMISVTKTPPKDITEQKKDNVLQDMQQYINKEQNRASKFAQVDLTNKQEDVTLQKHSDVNVKSIKSQKEKINFNDNNFTDFNNKNVKQEKPNVLAKNVSENTMISQHSIEKKPDVSIAKKNAQNDVKFNKMTFSEFHYNANDNMEPFASIAGNNVNSEYTRTRKYYDDRGRIMLEIEKCWKHSVKQKYTNVHNISIKLELHYNANGQFLNAKILNSNNKVITNDIIQTLQTKCSPITFFNDVDYSIWNTFNYRFIIE